MTPTVSVVIPSYRGGPYLREAVDSITRQSFDEWETIVVADGLTEDMSDLERDPRVRVIRQRQRGTSIARNVGVASARAALVAFLDDDDRMVGERLHAQVVAMRDENIVLCHSQIRLIDDQGAVYKPGYIRDYQYLDLLRIEGTPHLSASMVRRSVFEEVGGFTPLLRAGEDMDFIFKVAREGRCASCPRYIPSTACTPTTPGRVRRRWARRARVDSISCSTSTCMPRRGVANFPQCGLRSGRVGATSCPPGRSSTWSGPATP